MDGGNDPYDRLKRTLKAEINAGIEAATGKRIFYINWIGGTGGTISKVFAGYSPEVEEPAWKSNGVRWGDGSERCGPATSKCFPT